MPVIILATDGSEVYECSSKRHEIINDWRGMSNSRMSEERRLTGQDEPFTQSSFELSNDPIWRYTSLAKFVNILRLGESQGEGKLVFRRSDLLDDEYEGTLPNENREFQRQMWEQLKPMMEVQIDPKEVGLDSDHSVDDIGLLEESDNTFREKMRELTFLNCWRIDEYESSTMWRAYTSRSDGILVKSNIYDFVKSFRGWKARLFISDIDYRDFSSIDVEYGEGFVDLTALTPYFLKREEFKDEREIRAVLTDYDHPAMYPTGNFEAMPNPSGDEVRHATVDLEQLIDRIIVHPESRPYLKKTVRHILEKHGLDPNLVADSDLKLKSS